MATFIIGGDADCPTVRVTTEPVDGDSVRITLEVIPTDGGITGDLIGFYFKVPDDVEGDLSVSDAVGGGNDPSNTFNLVSGNDNISAGPYPGFDYLLEIGTNGIGLDDIQTFSFTLNGVPDSSDLSWLQAMAVRLTSVGVEGDRSDSCWLADITTVPDAIPGINIVKYTNGTDDICPVILVDHDVVWTYEVTNAGNVPLSDIVVTDDQGVTPIAVDIDADGFNDGDINGNGLLDLGEVWLFQASGIATEGAYENLGTVTGNYGDTEVTSSEDDCYFGAAPAVTIDKQINGYDDCFSILAGSPITFSFTVTNTGNVALTDLAVTDNVLGDIGLIASLGVGESIVFEVAGTAEAGEHHNTATVAGTVSDDVGNSVELSQSDEACYEGAAPAIAIVKMTNGTDDVCPDVQAGSTVTWTYYVTNTGNVALSDVSVIDDAGTPADDTDDFAPSFVGGDTNGDGKLDLDETWEYGATGEAILGDYHNVAYTQGSYTDDLGNSATVYANEDDCYTGHECFEGLTPGFWRQVQNWGKVTLDPDCYDLLGGTSFADVIPNTTFYEVFGVGDISWKVGKDTVTFDTGSSLLAALSLEGGGNTGALIRHAAAAVLNDCALEVDYALGHDAVIDAVQDVWGTPSQHGALKSILEGLNELGLEEDSDYVCAVLNDDYSIARYVTEYAVA